MRNPLPRVVLLVFTLVALLAALWAGLLRIGWSLPVLSPLLPALHGPLMVSAFFGTLISLERAVALNKRWTYIGPVLSAAGGILLVLGAPGFAGRLLLAAGSLVLVVVFASILRRHFTVYLAVMASGALCWLVGNSLWLAAGQISRVVFWWIGFLVLTISGERLELSRVVRLTRRAGWLFQLACGILLLGIVVTALDYGIGARLAGTGVAALAAWLVTYDIARHNLQKAGLTRFIAACLYSGFIWLGVSGVLALIFGGVSAGVLYDAFLHAGFVGFVFGMVFGHAPIILPALLNIHIAYRPSLYLPLALLNLSLLLRILGDLAANFEARRWGGLVNAIAILLYFGLMGFSLVRSRRKG